jgi:hypothetical protein
MKRSHLVPSLAASAFSIALVVAPQARAQARDPAAAQALFDQGKKLMAAGKTGEACPKFVESERLDPGVGTLLNLAACYEASGRNASAWSTFLEGESAARAEGNADAARVARSRADALATQLSKVTINVSHPNIPGLEVRRDDSVVGSAQWQVPIPSDPGIHHFRASAPGHKPWQSDVDLKGAGVTIEVDVPDLEVLPVSPAAPVAMAAPAVPGPTPSAPPDASDNTPRASSGLGTQRILAIGAAGAGVAGIVVGTVFGLKSKSKHDDAAGHCNGSSCDTVGVALRSDAISAGNVSTVAWIVGAAGLAGGAVLWFTAKPAKPQPSTELGLGVGTVLVRGAF